MGGRWAGPALHPSPGFTSSNYRLHCLPAPGAPRERLSNLGSSAAAHPAPKVPLRSKILFRIHLDLSVWVRELLEPWRPSTRLPSAHPATRPESPSYAYFAMDCTGKRAVRKAWHETNWHSAITMLAPRNRRSSRRWRPQGPAKRCQSALEGPRGSAHLSLRPCHFPHHRLAGWCLCALLDCIEAAWR